MTFGERLQHLRHEKKILQEDLAKVINVHRATVGKYENNLRFPDQEILQKIARYFDVSLDYLLAHSDIRNPYDIQQTKPLDSSLDSINKIYEELPPEEKKELEKYARYLKSKGTIED